MGLVILTAYAEQPSVKGTKTYDVAVTPRIKYLEPSEIADVAPKKNATGTIIGSVVTYGASRKVRRKYLVAERPSEVAVAMDPVTTNPYSTAMNLSITAAGTASGTGTALTTYLNKVTAATAASAQGLILPSATGARKAVVVINGTTAALSVYPVNAQSIDSAASNVGVSMAVGERRHFYAYSASNWRSEGALV